MATTKSTPALRWNAIWASMTSASSRARIVMTIFIKRTSMVMTISSRKPLAAAAGAHFDDRGGNAVRCMAVHVPDDLSSNAPPLGGQLLRLVERSLDLPP